MEPGLADPKGVSFRNKHFPNYYIAFENNVITIKEKQFTQEYNEQVTWYPRIGLSLNVDVIVLLYNADDVKISEMNPVLVQNITIENPTDSIYSTILQGDANVESEG